ncbi:MAG: peptidoglycan DD-metalloendopeptidase family protein [Patescibacteria group bacterium]
MTSAWSLFLILVVVFGGGMIKNSENSNDYGFGGPEEEYREPVILDLIDPSFGSDFSSDARETPLVFGIVEGGSSPSNNLVEARNGLQNYKVKPGDTLSKIAAEFDVSIETLRWANPQIRSSIHPGDGIKILPVSGVLYEIKDGDSVESVAAAYKIDPNLIKQYNPSYQKLFDSTGNNIVLPYAKPQGRIAYVNRYVDSLADLVNYFILPARGYNWGELHDHNAVDIADSCGRPIYASAEGLVTEESGRGFWNVGFGNYIMIEHPNGTRTRYAHTEKNFVRVGDYVSQGDEIAQIGNTGNVHGTTGCHVHFEVYGAKNPFAVK